MWHTIHDMHIIVKYIQQYAVIAHYSGWEVAVKYCSDSLLVLCRSKLIQFTIHNLQQYAVMNFV